MKILRSSLAWVLYWIGDGAAWLIDRSGDNSYPRIRMAVYQFCMTRSNKIQGGGPGPWERKDTL